MSEPKVGVVSTWGYGDYWVAWRMRLGVWDAGRGWVVGPAAKRELEQNPILVRRGPLNCSNPIESGFGGRGEM